MTNTAKTINSTRHMLTDSQAARIHGGALIDECTHPHAYKTGNYKKTKIEFFWWVSVESLCPDCGKRLWDKHIEF